MISIKLAKEISLLKWEGELNNCGYTHELNKKFPDLYYEIRNHFSCGFCVRHDYKDFSHDNKRCLNCEIANSKAECCLNENSLYSRIKKCGDSCDTIEEEENNQELQRELIKEMIEIIKNIPENE